jgi:CHAT domain-containing protein
MTGAEATLPNVLQHLPHVRALHFATHGFFIDDTLISQLELLAAEGPASSLTINRSRSSVLARNPLLRSGIVLAGANRQVRLDARGLPNLGDSILSGEAVMALNAEQVELVVLSACDSGQGDPTSGDGSWGMLAAFHIAGARNIVGGLWKVSDQATAQLMAEFYRHLGRKGTTPIEALRSAQLSLARHVAQPSSDRGIDLAQTLPVSDTEKNPRAAVASLRDWAGFVLSGPGF